MEVLKKESGAFEYASERIRSNVDVFKMVFTRDDVSASKRLRTSKEFLGKLIDMGYDLWEN